MTSRRFCIGATNDIWLVASESPKRTDGVTFSSERELSLRTARWTVPRLVQIWNLLSHVKPVKVIGSDLFLEPASSYRVTQVLAGADRVNISQQALHHRLQESGLLASVDQGRQMVQVRRTLEDFARQVLHLRTRDVVGEFEEALGTRSEELI